MSMMRKILSEIPNSGIHVSLEGETCESFVSATSSASGRPALV
jgi:hypothetical protein